MSLCAFRSGLEKAVDALRLFDFRGANVTLPHKQAVIPFLDEVSEISRLIGAVNTIVNEGGKLIGTTTDPMDSWKASAKKGHSFVGPDPSPSSATADRPAPSLSPCCMQDKPARVVLAARDPEKSRRLAAEIAERWACGKGGAAGSRSRGPGGLRLHRARKSRWS